MTTGRINQIAILLPLPDRGRAEWTERRWGRAPRRSHGMNSTQNPFRSAPAPTECGDDEHILAVKVNRNAAPRECPKSRQTGTSLRGACYSLSPALFMLSPPDKLPCRRVMRPLGAAQNAARRTIERSTREHQPAINRAFPP